MGLVPKCRGLQRTPTAAETEEDREDSQEQEKVRFTQNQTNTMTTPELKVGQRFLVKSGTDIIEYSVQEITADGKYHRISPATGPYSQWVELWTLDILHVFEEAEPSKEQS